MPSERDRRSDREPTPVGEPRIDEQMIRDRAYQIYEQHGRESGRDLENWLEAEREIRFDERGTVR